MSKAIKELITTELKSRYDGISSACIVETTGMTVQQQEDLRSRIRAQSGAMHIVKNRLARIAFRGGPLEPLGDALDGPCALVTGKGSIIDLAKALVEASKEHEQLKLKKAIFDGDADLLTVAELSKMKGLRELIGEIAMLVSSPGRAIAGCVKSPQSKIAGCLKAIAEKAA